MVFELLIKICLIVFSKSHYHLQNNSVLRDVNRGNMAVVGIIYVPEGQMDKDAQVSDTSNLAELFIRAFNFVNSVKRAESQKWKDIYLIKLTLSERIPEAHCLHLTRPCLTIGPQSLVINKTMSPS